VPSAALAQAPPPVATYTYTQDLHPLGFSPFANSAANSFTANSDLAFRGRLACQGHYLGFRIIDVSEPDDPQQISFTSCAGNQGDVVVYGDILIRSWNSPAAVGNPTASTECDGHPVPVGFEGIHVFDISALEDPELVGEVELSARPMASRALQNGNVGCGSHTDTVAPGPREQSPVDLQRHVRRQRGAAGGAAELRLARHPRSPAEQPGGGQVDPPRAARGP